MTLTPGAFACGVSLVGPSNISVFLPGWNVDRMAKRLGIRARRLDAGTCTTARR
jgi:hypothetical protein